MARKNGIWLYIKPEIAEGFAQLHAQRKKQGDTAAKNVQEALQGELMNIWLRWQDSLAENERCGMCGMRGCKGECEDA